MKCISMYILCRDVIISHVNDMKYLRLRAVKITTWAEIKFVYVTEKFRFI